MKNLVKFLFLVTGGALVGVILDTILNNKISPASLCFFWMCLDTLSSFNICYCTFK